ncbi:MAG: hypothetical protein IPK16_20330 [Anaerolineales bacterium]|nr:hypothetical protein [Anaerolineales bacterium]
MARNARIWCTNLRLYRAMLHYAVLRAFVILAVVGGDLLPSTADAAPATALLVAHARDEIVYIDPEGVIRALQQAVVGGALSYKEIWHSPDGGWRNAALGDFTNDGDAEIVAISESDTDFQLIIYDPVITSGEVDPDNGFGDLYWKILYRTSLPGRPTLILTGEFDPENPGQEIVYVYDPPEAGGAIPNAQVVILTQTNDPVDGTAWTTLAEMRNDDMWTDIASGNLEVTGIDNLVLIDEDQSRLSVYRLVNNTFFEYYFNASDTKPWQSAVVGQFDPTSALPELALGRTADRPLPTLLVWRYNGRDGFDEVYGRDFNPAPRHLFMANITGSASDGSSDDEVFFLRFANRTTTCSAPYTTPPFQLIMRNRGPDTPTTFEVCLDTANAFRYGAGGDVDGDGKDEIGVISPTQLRVFNSPDTTTEATDYTLRSNGLTIAMGNLDLNGSAQPDTLAVGNENQEINYQDVEAGTKTAETIVQLVNSTNSPQPITFYVDVKPPVSFVHWSLNTNTTPALMTVYVDASELLPNITYGANIVVNSTQRRVANVPLTIPVLVIVKDGLVVRPAEKAVVAIPCPPLGVQTTMTFTVIGGTPGNAI